MRHLVTKSLKPIVRHFLSLGTLYSFVYSIRDINGVEWLTSLKGPITLPSSSDLFLVVNATQFLYFDPRFSIPFNGRFSLDGVSLEASNIFPVDLCLFTLLITSGLFCGGFSSSPFYSLECGSSFSNTRVVGLAFWNRNPFHEFCHKTHYLFLIGICFSTIFVLHLLSLIKVHWIDTGSCVEFLKKIISCLYTSWVVPF